MRVTSIPRDIQAVRQRVAAPAASAHARQRGVALAVALILLILVTLIGLAAVRGVTTQQKMTANFYDRELAFQNAEAGLAAAAQALAAGTTNIRNCGQGGDACRANPFEDPNLAASSIQTVSSYTAGNNTTGQPQFVIENMGTYADPNSSTGFGQSANGAQYGAQGVTTTAIFYRITARSGNPSQIGDRAVVTLQAMYKQ
ncbi:pilus assembly PilX family protein [Solimonas flava]|uniref:pilus assembly PilX family protein n=1 Tax=Solimonas flava TaxID=415849 RepID=UPI001FDF9857|nr:PilX N-terminal domain-containing pilus assembly protein [Solimonas flava]